MEPTWDTDQWVQILTIHLLKIFEVLNLSKLSLKLCFNSVVDFVYQQVEPEPWAPAKKRRLRLRITAARAGPFNQLWLSQLAKLTGSETLISVLFQRACTQVLSSA